MARLKPLITSVVGVAILLFGLWFMARSSGGQADNMFRAEFDNVVGLTNNSPVLYKGVKVGQVTSINVKPDSGGEVAVLDIELQEDADLTLSAEASLVLRLKSILGEFFLDLETGNSPKAFDMSKAMTKTHRDTSLDQLLFQGAALYEEVSAAEETQSIADEVRSLLETSGEDLTAITENTKLIVEGLNTRAESISRIIQNLDILTGATEGKAAQLGVAIEDVNRTLAGLRETLVSNNARIKNLLETVNEILVTTDLAKLDEQLARLPEYIERLDRGLLILRSFLQHRLPLFAVVPSLEMDLNETAIAQAQNMARNNPFVAKILADVIEAIFFPPG